MDTVLNCKVPAVTDRALAIYCATKGETKKDVVTAALSKAIPSEYFKTAEAEINGKKKQGGKG